MRRAHPAAVLALVASLVVAGCSSEDSTDASTSTPAPSPSTSAPASPAESETPADNGAVEVVTLLSRNLEAFKKATGKYPKPGSTDYQQVVRIDQADGYTLAYAVDGAGVMTICASSDNMAASYDSKTGEIADGKGTCAG